MIWKRGFRSLRRLPAARLGRIAALAVAAGVGGSLAVSSSLLFLLGLLAALFLLGMETIEPLSQEIDRPDRTDGLPIDRGLLYAHHLVAPAALLAAAAAVAAATASVIRPSDAAAAWAIAIPTLWAGALGPVVAAVLDSSTPIAVADTTLLGAPRDTDVSLMPPEFAGFSNALSTFIPVAISAIGVVPVVAMRADPSVATAGRIVVGVALIGAAASRVDSASGPMGREDSGVLRSRPRAEGSSNLMTSAPSAARSSDTVLSAVGLTKHYGGAVALAPLDIDIATGERITLIGHNGSGKTTFIRMLAGLLEPSDGSALVGGHPLGSIEARATLSYLSDEPVFYDDLSVWEHLEYIARLHGTEDWEQHSIDLLDAVGIVERADDLPATFSRGLKQKAAIAMAFVRPVRCDGRRRAVRRA